MRLRAPFIRMVLRNRYMELELGDVVIFAEARGRGLYAEIYIGDVGYIYEKGRWYSYDSEGNPKTIAKHEAEALRKLGKRLSTLPRYHVLEQLTKALKSVETTT